MAGVYIPGIKMPEHCWQCGFHDADNDCMAIYAQCDEFWSVMDVYGEGRRPDWCPLMEVPDHGDLIDRDVFVDRVTNYSRISTREIGKALRATPTVIPADEGE